MSTPDVTEEWRPIPGTDGYYEVSSLGGFRSWRVPGWPDRRATRPKPVKPRLGTTRYPQVHVYWADGRHHNRELHALVAEAFLGPKPEGLQVRHLNGDPLDNRAANLAYGTQRENELDKVRYGKGVQGEKNPQSKLTRSNAQVILAMSGMANQTLVGKVFGVSQATVSDIWAGRTWSHLAKGGG